MNTCKLCELSAGGSGTVSALRGSGSQNKRLADLGLTKGTPVQCLHISPLGDPAAYRIRGCVIALRHSDAQAVLIAKEADAN